MADLDIIAPGNTDLQGNVFAPVAQGETGWSATVDLFLQGGPPDPDTEWRPSPGVTLEPGGSNPFLRYQRAIVEGSGTWDKEAFSTFTVSARVGRSMSNVLTVSLLRPAVRMAPEAPVLALDSTVLFSARPAGTVTFDATSWRVPAGAVVTQHASDWSSVNIQFPRTAFAPGTIQYVALAALNGGPTVGNAVYLAPEGTTDDNAAFTYDPAGIVSMAWTTPTWPSLPPSASWSGLSLPYPAIHALRTGEFTPQLVAPQAIVGIACYVMNTYVFQAAVADSAGGTGRSD